MGRESRHKAKERSGLKLDDNFRIALEGVGEAELVNINMAAILGQVEIKRDTRGVRYFDFPAPYNRLRIFDGSRLRAAKACAFVIAARHFLAIAKQKAEG